MVASFGGGTSEGGCVASTPFNYRLLDQDADAPDMPAPEISPTLELLHKIAHFLGDHIVYTPEGHRSRDTTVGRRMLVFHAILTNDDSKSCTEVARELGISTACLSYIGSRLSKQLGMSAPWQRPNAREISAKRAKGTHDGTWVATSDRWVRWKRRQDEERKNAHEQRR